MNSSRRLCANGLLSASVARYTISQAVPHLCHLFHNPGEISSRPATLVLLADLINAARNSMALDNAQVVEPPLTIFKDEILGAFTVGLTSVSTRSMALSGLKAVVLTRGLLSDDELRFIVHNMDQIIDENPDALVGQR